MTDPLVLELRRRKGERTYADFAAEVGLSERMVYALFSGATRAGHRALKRLLAYDQTLEPLVIDHLRGAPKAEAVAA